MHARKREVRVVQSRRKRGPRPRSPAGATRLRWAQWGWLIGLCACSEGVHQARPVACDPLTDNGCPAGDHCRVLAGGSLACLAPAAAGLTCTAASCAPAEACVEVEGVLGCQPLCRLQSDGCGDGGVCAYGIAWDRPWGICPTACEPGGCAAGSTCAPTTATPYPTCVAIGDAPEGAPCSATRCQAGMACLLREDQPRCAVLCDASTLAPCPDRCTGLIEGQVRLRFCADE